MLEAYLATRRARFERHDLDHPATPVFVDVRGRGLSVDQVKYVGGHLKLPAGGQWVPTDGHCGVWSTRREVFDDVAPGPGDMGRSDVEAEVALR